MNVETENKPYCKHWQRRKIHHALKDDRTYMNQQRRFSQTKASFHWPFESLWHVFQPHFQSSQYGKGSGMTSALAKIFLINFYASDRWSSWWTGSLTNLEYPLLPWSAQIWLYRCISINGSSRNAPIYLSCTQRAEHGCSHLCWIHKESNISCREQLDGIADMFKFDVLGIW